MVLLSERHRTIILTGVCVRSRPKRSSERFDISCMDLSSGGNYVFSFIRLMSAQTVIWKRLGVKCLAQGQFDTDCLAGEEGRSEPVHF